MIGRVLRRWLTWLVALLAVQAIAYQVAVIAGWIYPEPIDTYHPPDAGWALYADYGLFGPEFTYIVTALEFILAAVLLSVTIPAFLSVVQWLGDRTGAFDSRWVSR